MSVVKKEPFKIAVNDQYKFDVQPESALNLDLVEESEALFHLLDDEQAYRIELLEADYHNRSFLLKIDGTKYRVNISDYYERLVKKLGFSIGGAQKLNMVKAPMPGLVVQVLVEPGQAVQKGDPLLILEAMKMENVIKASGEGTVKKINTKQGEPVDKGVVLLEFE